MGRCQLEQVLLNLLRNAFDALAEVPGRPGQPGRIIVSVVANPEARMVRCAVQDTGCGIPPEQRETVFQQYYTTKPPDRGTGLGLSIVRQIVEACGGSIHVESQPEQGSTFCIVLPVV
jgi:two-component system NtrC family sensor kinase